MLGNKTMKKAREQVTEETKLMEDYVSDMVGESDEDYVVFSTKDLTKVRHVCFIEGIVLGACAGAAVIFGGLMLRK